MGTKRSEIVKGKKRESRQTLHEYIENPINKVGFSGKGLQNQMAGNFDLLRNISYVISSGNA